MTTTEDTQGQFRGYDDEGHRVVVGWNNQDGTEYLIGLTFCCQATSKATEAGIVCRACYSHCEMSLAADARVVRGPEDGTLVVVPEGGWRMKEIDGRWQSIAPTAYVVYRGETIAFGPGTWDECREYVGAQVVS